MATAGDAGDAGDKAAMGLDPQLDREPQHLTAGVCRSLHEPERLMVMYAPAGAPRSVGRLSTILDVTQSDVSQHLAVLRDRGLVGTGRDGSRATYSLRRPRAVEAIDILPEVTSDELDRRRALRAGV